MATTSTAAYDTSRRFLEEVTTVEEQSAFVDFLQNHTFAFFGYVLGALIGLILSYCIIRECLYHKYGYDCCSGATAGNISSRSRMSRSRHNQYLDDQQVAIDLQREMAEEIRQEVMAMKRKVRRGKYEKFLMPYTMVVEKGDLGFLVGEAKDNKMELLPTGNCNEEGERVDSTGSKDADLEAAVKTVPSATSLHEVDTDTIELEQERMLRLPVKNDAGEHVHVDGECAICLLEYEPGDSVVWSTRKVCKHAFHDECILVWLAKGKKRCPVCRQFFVPGSSIDDKKVITHDEDDEEANITGTMLYEDVVSYEDPLVNTSEHADLVETSKLEDDSQRDAADRLLFRRLSREVLA